MADRSSEVQCCFIHQDEGPKPVVFLHEHHRSPRAYGGGNEKDNLVWLCSGCHDFLHRLAMMVTSGKAALAQDHIEQYLPFDIRARGRLNTLVQEVVQARTAFEDKLLDEDDTVLLTLKIPRTLHTMLKTLSMDHVRSNGRRIGLYAFATAILKRYVMDHLQGTAPLTESNKVINDPSKKDLYNLKTSPPIELRRFK